MDGYWKAFVELNGKSLEEARDIFRKLADESDCVVWYYHPFGRKRKGPHFHALIKDGKNTAETYRNHLKAEFGVSGPGKVAVSNKYDDKNPNSKRAPIMTQETIKGYIKYMTKGVHDPFFNKGFDEELLKECKALWVPDEVLPNVTLERKESSRITRITLAKEVYAEYTEKYVDADSYDEKGNLKVRMVKLIETVGEVCKRNNKGRDYDNCAKIAQTVLADLDPNYWLQKVFRRL